ncbi:MAG: hypothetical protein AAF409_16110 [Pseudomonadota bacterium]
MARRNPWAADKLIWVKAEAASTVYLRRLTKLEQAWMSTNDQKTGVPTPADQPTMADDTARVLRMAKRTIQQTHEVLAHIHEQKVGDQQTR